MQVVLPVGQAVGVGTYTTDVGGAKVYSRAAPSWTTATRTVTRERRRSTSSHVGALVTKLTASFAIGCRRHQRPPAQGIVRINSTVPFSAIRMSPLDHTYASARNFGTVLAGSASDWWAGTIENVGTVATEATASVERRGLRD